MAAGAPDNEIISLSAGTGWKDAIAGSTGHFEVFILPQGELDAVASRMSHKAVNCTMGDGTYYLSPTWRTASLNLWIMWSVWDFSIKPLNIEMTECQ